MRFFVLYFTLLALYIFTAIFASDIITTSLRLFVLLVSVVHECTSYANARYIKSEFRITKTRGGTGNPDERQED